MDVGHGWQTPRAPDEPLVRRQSLEASKDFSSALCKTHSLPRELGWYAGGPIVAVIHDNGQSAVRH